MKPIFTIHEGELPVGYPDGLYSRNLSTFYEEHFECFIGDRRISEPSEKTLAQLRARHLLFLAARTEQPR
jgi:hypothetical protein